jgi:hypothetical protein
MTNRWYIAIFFAFLSIYQTPIANAAVIIKIDAIPKILQIDQEYAFYITAKNTSDAPIANTSLQLTFKDRYSDADNVLINKDFASLELQIRENEIDQSVVEWPYIDGAWIERKPVESRPYHQTSPMTFSTAICGWGTLLPYSSARCAFRIRTKAETTKFFPLTVRVKSSSAILASNVLKYSIKPTSTTGAHTPQKNPWSNIIMEDYLSYRDFFWRFICNLRKDIKKDIWTPEAGECYSENQRQDSHPISYKIRGLDFLWQKSHEKP